MQTDFRHELRARTHADHERVDDLISTLDLSTVAGFVRFLSVHRACFAEMLRIAPAGSAAAEGLAEMLRRIDSDLAVMAADTPTPLPATRRLAPMDLLAVDYVIEGSRLGSRVLTKRWQAAQDARVRRADGYFTLLPVPGRWRAVCDQLSAIPVESDRAKTIVIDARILFSVFHDAASATAPG